MRFWEKARLALMHHHLTLPELAQRFNLTEQELFEECNRLGVPILHGRVDYKLLAQAFKADSGPTLKVP